MRPAHAMGGNATFGNWRFGDQLIRFHFAEAAIVSAEGNKELVVRIAYSFLPLQQINPRT